MYNTFISSLLCFMFVHPGLRVYLSCSGSTTRMQLLTISLLVASTLAQGEDPCPPNPNSPSCDDPPQETICQLTGKRDSDCKQNEGDSNKCDKMGVDVSSEAHADMFATRCKQICEESRDAEGAENVCRFYKVSVSRKSGSSLLHHV